MTRILVVMGTRPEAIKMAPVVAAAHALPKAEVRVCVTGQHRQMLDDVLSVFKIKPDFDLDIMRPDQTLSSITSTVLSGVEQCLSREKYDWVLVQGDTTTAFAASLAAFYQKVKVGYVEAGLRTGDKFQPWPEEINRRLVGVLADVHFAPTKQAAANLLREGYDEKTILLTGNTVIDALQSIVARIGCDPQHLSRMSQRYPFLNTTKRIVLVTGHRRENFGSGFQEICEALSRIAERSDVEIIYPVHLNPNVRGPVNSYLSGKPNIHLIEPLDYVSFVHFMSRAALILTNSGGIQEEAPGLGKPVLVMRNTSERMEAVEAGCALLVGTSPDVLVREAGRLLDDQSHYARMSSAVNPFGDGKAAQRIVAAIS